MAELHDAVGCAAKAEGRGIAESEARHGELIGVEEREVLVVRAAVDDELKGTRVAGIDDDPDAHHGGQVEARSAQVAVQVVEVNAEAVEHHANGNKTEKQKEVTI